MTGKMTLGLAVAMALPLAPATAQELQQSTTSADMEAARARAIEIVEQMEPEEKVRLTWGIMPLPLIPGTEVPDGAIPAAGFVPGVERLGIPDLTETDGPLGVSYVMGLREDYATAMPAGIAMGATFNRELAHAQGVAIGAEARAKGFNVLLAGGANLARDPRNGRTFEYVSEDPLLTGQLIGWNIAGIQSNEIVSTIKHFALNGQETGRRFVDVLIDDAAARESDLLAFQIGIEIGQPGSVMCAYNRVNGEQGCASSYLLNEVLKDDWGYRGWVMSDWGAVPGLYAAWNGLDQQSGAQLDPDVFLDDDLLAAAQQDPDRMARLDDMNARVLTGLIASGVFDNPPSPGGEIDWEANALVAQMAAEQGIVLLRNEGNALPLATEAGTILVVGGYADSGVLSGAGSSQVHTEGGPAISLSISNQGVFANFAAQQYHRGAPLDAIRARAPNATVRYRTGDYASQAAALAADADVVIVFATQWMTEGLDVGDLGLPNGQDALIAEVAAANPNTIVVLETGGPVDMPWLEEVAAVIEAWYPGQGGAQAIAGVLFGDVNPSGRLPITFPRSESQLPRAVIPGMLEFDPDFGGNPPSPDARLSTDYNIEGSDLGYRWNARQGQQALFPFGFGLSYTSFAASGLATDGSSASFTLSNTGDRAGATVGQLYLVSRNGEPRQRLVGFERVELAPGQSASVEMTIDPRLLADWDGEGWTIAEGTYGFAIGDNAEALGDTIEVELEGRSWQD